MPVHDLSQDALRRLPRLPWEQFVAEVRALVMEALAGSDAYWRARRAAADASDARAQREIDEGLEGCVLDRRLLASSRSADHVKVYANVFYRTEAYWDDEALQRRVWIRFWGLLPGTPRALRLSKTAERAAIQWVLDSYPGWLLRASLPWEERLAELGSGEAAMRLAWACSKHFKSRRGTAADLAAAVRWNKRAVALGESDAATAVGYAYFYGKGVPRDRAAALRWYRRAALGPGARSRDVATRLDSAASMANLGRMYRKGEGVQKSWPLAIRWFTRAARLGSGDAAHFLAEIYSGDEGPPARPRLELSWRRIAARRGCADCRKTLGIYLWNGKRLRRDRPQAMRLYEKAAQADDTWAMYLLGLAYREIDPPQRDLALSRRWLRRAAARGVKPAQRALRTRTAR